MRKQTKTYDTEVFSKLGYEGLSGNWENVYDG